MTDRGKVLFCFSNYTSIPKQVHFVLTWDKLEWTKLDQNNEESKTVVNTLEEKKH